MGRQSPIYFVYTQPAGETSGTLIRLRSRTMRGARAALLSLIPSGVGATLWALYDRCPGGNWSWLPRKEPTRGGHRVAEGSPDWKEDHLWAAEISILPDMTKEETRELLERLKESLE